MDDARRALIHDLNAILELQLMDIALKTWPVWADYWKKREMKDTEVMEGLERLKAMRGDKDADHIECG